MRMRETNRENYVDYYIDQIIFEQDTHRMLTTNTCVCKWCCDFRRWFNAAQAPYTLDANGLPIPLPSPDPVLIYRKKLQPKSAEELRKILKQLRVRTAKLR